MSLIYHFNIFLVDGIDFFNPSEVPHQHLDKIMTKVIKEIQEFKIMTPHSRNVFYFLLFTIKPLSSLFVLNLYIRGFSISNKLPKRRNILDNILYIGI